MSAITKPAGLHSLLCYRAGKNIAAISSNYGEKLTKSSAIKPTALTYHSALWVLGNVYLAVSLMKHGHRYVMRNY